MNERLSALHRAGVSIWLDDLSRARVQSGNLRAMMKQDAVTGVTTNPTIFASAFSDLSLYGDDLAAHRGRPVGDVIRALMADDVAVACDELADTYLSTKGYDGRVSIEVEPSLANDTQATIDQASLLHDLVGKPNVLIKIPATKAGLLAIRASIAAGISVNATLIFSLARYREVMDAYLSGLEDALGAGKDLSQIHSVASFFVSRVDTEVDKHLEQIGNKQALALRGQAGIANARLAFESFQRAFASQRFATLQQQGANLQRPLWASTGTKNLAYSDILYVSDLIAAPCVNTMPEKTIRAFADHGEVTGDTITPHIAEAHASLNAIQTVGVDLDDVFETLEIEGVNKFVVSWDELVAAVSGALEKIK